MNLEKLDNRQREFIQVKTLEGLQKTTLDGYYKVFLNVNSFERFDYNNLDNLKSQIIDYFTSIQVNKPTTYNAKRKSLTTFFNYLISQNILNTNPIKLAGIKKRKEKTEPRPCKADDLKSFLNAIDINTYAGFRDYTYIILIADTGIRPAEACRLTESHIITSPPALQLNSDITKTSKPRTLPLSRLVLDNILKLIQLNKEYWDEDRVFLTSDGNPMTTVNFQKRFVTHSNKSNVKITPYQLRHYFGTEYLKNPSGNLIYLQSIMGHSDLSMTKRYISIDLESLEKNHKAASPLNLVLERNTRVRKLFKWMNTYQKFILNQLYFS